MRHLARSAFSVADYVALEEMSIVKHEFLDGVVYAMAGGSPEHAAVAANVIRLLGTALTGRKCRVYTSDLRIRVKSTGLITYPDTSVICEHVDLDSEDTKGHTATNPTLLVEVLSPSTEEYDRGEKLTHYKQIPSLREVALVAYDEPRVDLWRRIGKRWTQLTFRGSELVILESLDCTLSLDEIFRDPLST